IDVYKLVVSIFISVDPKLCQKYPIQRHCIIEWMSRERLAHTERYTYKWDRRKCLLIRWAKYCRAPLPVTKNFDSEELCYFDCGGWA
ncbi:uncharacterized protein LOC123690042, partial [Pieris rapae]|uniref:uncharacterized protein LOC123690042 n=1 Tax=Pieris rapae TaxID=64459 RepID=UPI001E27A9C8